MPAQLESLAGRENLRPKREHRSWRIDENPGVEIDHQGSRARSRLQSPSQEKITRGCGRTWRGQVESRFPQFRLENPRHQTQPHQAITKGEDLCLLGLAAGGLTANSPREENRIVEEGEI